MQGVSTEHFVQRHVKTKVIEDCILRPHQYLTVLEAVVVLPTGIPRIDWVPSIFFFALADVCLFALAINVRVLFRERSG